VFGVVLNEPRILFAISFTCWADATGLTIWCRKTFGEREAASVAEHVRVGAARFLGYQDRALFFFYSAAWDRFSERVHQGYLSQTCINRV
jgi:hypothetical protein